MTLGLFFAIITGLSWVVTGAVVGLAERRRCGAERQQLVGASLALAVAALAYAVGPLIMPGSGAFRFGADPRAALCMFLWGFLNYWMILSMGRAMARGPNGPVWTITQSGFVFPFALGVLSGNTRFSWLLAAGLALALANVAVTGLAKGAGTAADAPAAERRGGRWFPLALVAFVFCGANQCAVNLVSYLPPEVRPESLERYVWGNFGALAGWLLHAAWKRLREGSPPPDPELRAKYAFLLKICAVNIAIAFVASMLFLFEALDRLEEAGAAAIASPVMVVSCFLGFAAYSGLVLRERLSRTQWIAFAAGLAGIVLLSVAAG